jgi:hypothetical protein
MRSYVTAEEKRKNAAHGKEIERLQAESDRLAATVSLGRDYAGNPARLGARRPYGEPVNGNQYHSYLYEVITDFAGPIAYVTVDVDRETARMDPFA